MDAHLVLKAGAEQIIPAAKRAIIVDEEFGHEEKRNALRSGRGIGQASQHQMHDIVGQVMLAIGDENLLAEDAVAAVTGAFRTGTQYTKIGTGVRFSQIHCAHPLAADELFEIDVLQLLGGVLFDRFDCAHGQCRRDGEGKRPGVPHFAHCHRHHRGQALTAIFRRAGQRVPAAFDPVAI